MGVTGLAATSGHRWETGGQTASIYWGDNTGTVQARCLRCAHCCSSQHSLRRRGEIHIVERYPGSGVILSRPHISTSRLTMTISPSVATLGGHWTKSSSALQTLMEIMRLILMSLETSVKFISTKVSIQSTLTGIPVFPMKRPSVL